MLNVFYSVLITLLHIVFARQINGEDCNLYWSNHISKMRTIMDESVNPCENFFRYACGNWKLRIPNNLKLLGTRDTLSSIQAENKIILLQYLDKLNSSEISNTEKNMEFIYVKNFYKSCMRFQNHAEQKEVVQFMKNALEQSSNGEWETPEITGKMDDFSWISASAQLRRYGVQSLWRLNVKENWQSSDQMIFYLSTPSLELLKNKRLIVPELDDEIAFLYERYIKYLMLNFGINISRAKRIASEVIDFEKQLLNLCSHEERLHLRNPITLQTFNKKFQSLQLKKYFDTLTKDFNLPNNYDSYVLIVADEVYLQKLSILLQNVPKQTLSRYLFVQFLVHYEIQMHVDDTVEQQQDYCIQLIQTLMPYQLSLIFLKAEHNTEFAIEQFLQQTTNELQVMFSQLKDQFEHLLNNSKVFEKDILGHSLGLDKLRAMQLLIPQWSVLNSHRLKYPRNQDNVRFESQLLELSKNFNKDQFYEVFKNINIDFTSATLNNSFNKNSKCYKPLSVNAYYHNNKNTIELPLGLLRPPIYQPCMKLSSVYGSILYIIGHEIIHGFDYDGLSYDKNGNVIYSDDSFNSSENANSWNAKSLIQFGTRANCYLSNRYSKAALNINENIADTEGLRLAFQTLRIVQNHNNESISLYKQNHVDVRNFFLSFAQIWCGSGITENALHPNNEDRVNNVLGNLNQFANTYKCRNESFMNPAQKCRIW